MPRVLIIVNAGPEQDWRKTFAEGTESEVAMRLGVQLTESSVPATLKVAVPWTAPMAWALRAITKGAAGDWTVRMEATPAPSTVAASSAWSTVLPELRGERRQLSPADRYLAHTAAMFKEGTVLGGPKPTEDPVPELSPDTTQSILDGESPKRIAQRLSLSGPGWERWLRQHVSKLWDVVSRGGPHTLGQPSFTAWTQLLSPLRDAPRPAAAQDTPTTPTSGRPTADDNDEGGDDELDGNEP